MSAKKTRTQRDLPATIDQAGEITRRIHVVHGERVMLDEDLAALYGVETKRLNEAVRRNPGRFPEDFAFRLTEEEVRGLKSQFATSNGRGGRRRSAPRAFTEEGVAMLSSVLSSPRAVAVNILIMRAFVQLRRAQGQYIELRQRIDDLARSVEGHDELPRRSSRPLMRSRSRRLHHRVRSGSARGGRRCSSRECADAIARPLRIRVIGGAEWPNR